MCLQHFVKWVDFHVFIYLYTEFLQDMYFPLFVQPGGKLLKTEGLQKPLYSKLCLALKGKSNYS